MPGKGREGKAAEMNRGRGRSATHFQGKSEFTLGKVWDDRWSRARGPDFYISGLPGKGRSQMSQPSWADQGIPVKGLLLVSFPAAAGHDSFLKRSGCIQASTHTAAQPCWKALEIETLV